MQQKCLEEDLTIFHISSEEQNNIFCSKHRFSYMDIPLQVVHVYFKKMVLYAQIWQSRST